ncbi:C-C motif chemokine 3-like [Hoplias malabaricus]|uniref:C-C motif chemokine 3-like n=1 Tax=Hoplias malabaricus TaxID=27720 RepID=UPI00346367E4
MAALRLLLLSAVVALLSVATITEGMRMGSGPKSCCFDFISQPMRLKMVKSYSFTSKQCSKDAVLFTTKKGRVVCANPAESWVREHIKVLDSKMVGDQSPL